MNTNANEMTTSENTMDEMVSAENQTGAGAAKGAEGKVAEPGKKPADVASEIVTNADGKPYGVKFTFGGRQDRVVELNMHKLTEEVLLMATLHGLKQKLGDAAAISRNTETGKSATIEDKFNAVRELADRLLEGEWNKRRESTGAGAGGLLLRALTRLYANRMTAEQVATWLGQKTDKEKAGLRKNPKIMEEISRIRAEDGAGTYTGDDLLIELEGLTPAKEEA